MTNKIDYSSIGRLQLEDEHKAMFDNLSATQARCTQLIDQYRHLKESMNTDDFSKYQRLAARTSTHKDQLNRDAIGDRLLMACMGIGGEGGEVTDLAKKLKFHNHKFDKEKMIKELGDVLWYIAEAASALDIPLALIASRNIDKLRSRYPDGFTTEQSENRKDGDT